MKRIFFILLLVSLCIIHGFSQEVVNSDKMWSLHDCMLFAIDNSSKTKIQKAKNDDYRLDYRESYMNWIPSINANSSASTNFGRSLDPETNIYTNVASFSNSYSISAEYTIFNGFSVVNNYRIAKIAQQSGIEEYKQVEDVLCLEIIQAYFNVLYKTGMVKITSEQLEESKKNLKQTSVMLELGLKGQADLLQVEAQVATNDYNHVKEQNNLADALTVLKGLMFFPIDKEIQIDTNMVWLVDPFKEKESADTIFNAAKHFLPAIKIAEYQLHQAQYNYQTAKLRILPNLYAQGGYSTGYAALLSEGNSSSPFMDQIKSKSGEYIGVGISIPIFNSLNRWNTRGKMKNAMLRAQYAKEQKLQEVETEIQRAVQDMEGAAKEYVQADKRANAQKIAYIANSKKYEEGLISVLDLQTSSNLLLVSKAEKLNSALTYILKSKVVKYYKGIPYLEQD